MSAGFDMSLNYIIRSNRSYRSGPARYRGRGTGPGPSRRFQNPYPYRASPYIAPQVRAPTMVQDADSRHHPLVFHGPAVESATKIYVSNLDCGVSDEDIRELFSEVGLLKRYGIHYDRSGRSKGTAEVVFTNRAEALAAVKRFYNVCLDGKPMMIELMGTNIVSSAAPPPPTAPPGNPGRDSRWDRGGTGPVRRPLCGRGGGGGSLLRRGHTHGRRRAQAEYVSAEDLDADLDKYLSEAMKIS